MKHDTTAESGSDAAATDGRDQSSALWPMMLLLVVAAGSLLAIQMRRPKPANPYLGVSLPPLSAEGWLNTSGPPTREELRGSVVLFDFWSTSCPNCVREMPQLAALHDRFRDHGFKVIGLTPESGEAAMRVEQLAAKEKIDWPIGYGAGFPFEVMAIELTPTYILYDRNDRRGPGGQVALTGIFTRRGKKSNRHHRRCASVPAGPGRVSGPESGVRTAGV
jgi:thiol-disulfide isomerase/thioredoxin